jgi:enamine deaminase RidA (YjgF/YER057c/UK114 family)
MTKQQVNPPSVFRSLDHGFSQAVAATGNRTLYVSGQTAWDAQRNLVGEADLGAQARQAFRNLGPSWQLPERYPLTWCPCESTS